MGFVFVALCVILGFLPSNHATCTYKEIGECQFYSSTHADCPMYQKTIDCLEKVKPKCTAPFMPYITSKLNYFKSDQALCPGLEDGKCYFGLSNKCTEGVNHFNSGNETCSLVIAKYAETLKCLTDAKVQCPGTKSVRRTDFELKELEHSHEWCTDPNNDKSRYKDYDYAN